MLRKIVLRSAFNYDADAVSEETGFACEGPSKTQQQFAEEVDINTIVKRFGIGAPLPLTEQMPVSGDFTGVSDFTSAMRLVRQAEEAFYELPAEVRARFGNDPARVIEFLDDGRNREEAVKLGLVQPPPEKTRDAVAAIDELAAKLVKVPPL